MSKINQEVINFENFTLVINYQVEQTQESVHFWPLRKHVRSIDIRDNKHETMERLYFPKVGDGEGVLRPDLKRGEG